jgi:hypothetical protein
MTDLRHSRFPRATAIGLSLALLASLGTISCGKFLGVDFGVGAGPPSAADLPGLNVMAGSSSP